ncbi:XAC0095 family protein [Rhodanobacter geophilus]|uniref:XAC0095-like domain-containing protein n=1 Tax=Rhodanobacter geophilus TaxID=3162488 RepID=A0ABV3QLE0_9GAMM
MTTFDSDDLETTGYFLPEDSQLRLKKLREYVEFLSHLAQPRMADEEQECLPEIRVGKVAICLELLEEQIGRLLDEISWPAYRSERAAAAAGTEPETAEPEVAKFGADGRGAPYLFGVTLDQIDEINLLLDMIRAHGDVVIASHDAEFADHTLSQMGQAIFSGVEKLRGIIRDVDSQQLGPVRGTRTGVREWPAAYHALAPRFPMPSASRIAQQLSTCQ